MDTLQKKTLKTTRGFTYTYNVAPASSDKPTLLILHGCPDSAATYTDFAAQHLVPAGYGVIIPDCLGYGETSKPTDPKEYAFTTMTQDMVEILDAESISKAIPTGHDWGAPFAQRVWIHHPSRCAGLIQLNTAYTEPFAAPFDLQGLKQAMTAAMGFFPMWYWELFTSPSGPKLIGDHLESFFDLLHGDPATWLDTLCAEGGLEAWLVNDRTQELLPYAAANEGMKKEFVERLDRDGMEAPLCWYRSMVEQVQYEAEKDVPKERFVVDVPYLFVGAKRDVLSPMEALEGPKAQGLLPKVTAVELDVPHWGVLDKPKETADVIHKWLGEKY